MLKILLNTLAALFISCLLSLPASAEMIKSLKVKTDDNAFGGPVIEVESDGDEWTHLKGASHELDLSVDIEVGSGWRIYSAYLGLPNADLAGTANETDVDRKLGGGKGTKKIKDNLRHSFHTDGIGGIDALSIVGMCNRGDAPATQEQVKFSTIGVGIKAFIIRKKDFPDIVEGGSNDFGRSETAYARAPVTVRCLAGPTKVKAPPAPYSVDLKVRQIGTSCPKRTEVTAILGYNVATQARFRFKHNGEYSRIFKPKTVDTQYKPTPNVSPGPKGRYVVERTKVYHLDPGQHHFRIETEGGKKSEVKTIRVECPPFKVTSMWLSYKVGKKAVCEKSVKEKTLAYSTRPGTAPFEIKTAGGLVVHTGTLKFERKGMKYVAKVRRNLMMGAFDSDMMAKVTNQQDANSGWVLLKVDCLEVLSGTLDLRAFAPKRCKGEAAISIRTNIAEKVPYLVSCTSGRSWSGKVTAHQTAPGTFIGVAVLPFDVSNNEQVNCALKTRKPLPVKVLAVQGRKYSCHKRTVEPGSNDLTSDPRPTHDDPKPTIIVDPVPEIACVNGRKVRDMCLCKRGDRLVKTGARGYRCDERTPPVVVTPPNGPSSVSETTISCAGGLVRNGNCHCDRKHKPFKVGKNAWRCVKTAVIITPPNGPSSVPGGPSSVPETTISCAGGVVRNQKCHCARAHKPVKAGKNAWRCVKSVVIDPVRTDKGKVGQTSSDAAKRAEEARKRAEADRKRREAAKKAAEAHRKREAAKKAAEARRKREAAKKAAVAARKKAAAAAAARTKRQSGNPPAARRRAR